MDFPYGHYWLADDGRVFSAPSQAVVDKTDAGYVAWIAGGDIATRWPLDDAGVQTTAVLNAVLLPYGLSTTGLVRSAAGPTLVKSTTDTAWAKVKPRDQACIAGRASLPENLDMIARAATAMGTTPKAWFDLALGVTA